MKVVEQDINEQPVSGGIVILFLIGAVLLSTLVSLLILLGIGYIKGSPIQDLVSNLTVDSNSSDRNLGRILVCINHLFTFILPSLIVAWLLFKNNWSKTLGFSSFKRILNPILGMALILVVIPISGLLYWINQQIPLPDLFTSMEAGTNQMIQAMLVADSNTEIIFNLFIIGIVPAIGEELVFRGILQRQFANIFSNHHLAILISAFLFSAIHMQFEGFLPRFFLGGMLGYLFYWTGNLWIPLLGHFAHNAFQVIAIYFSGENIRELDISAVELRPTHQLLIFAAITALISYYIYQINRGNRLTLTKS